MKSIANELANHLAQRPSHVAMLACLPLEAPGIESRELVEACRELGYELESSIADIAFWLRQRNLWVASDRTRRMETHLTYWYWTPVNEGQLAQVRVAWRMVTSQPVPDSPRVPVRRCAARR